MIKTETDCSVEGLEGVAVRRVRGNNSGRKSDRRHVKSGKDWSSTLLPMREGTTTSIVAL